MFDVVKKMFAKKDTPEDFTGRFRVGRGAGGFAFHVIEGDVWQGLCGIDVVEKKSEITPEELVARLPRTHETFYYCSKCTTSFTGLSKEEQGVLRDSKKN